MRCQEDRVLIRVLVAREMGLHLWLYTVQASVAESSSQSSRTKRGSEWIAGRRIQATVDEQLRSHVDAQVEACPLGRHTRGCSENVESRGLEHIVRKQKAVVFHKCEPSQHPQEDHHQA